MGSGASARHATTTPIYGAYDSPRHQPEKWNLREISKTDDHLKADLNQSSSDLSMKSFAFSDSNQTLSDEASNRGSCENESIATSVDGRRPKKVRFSDVVTVSRGRSGSVETAELSTPDDDQISWTDVSVDPDVLRVHLENGQTKSIRYDRRTTVVSQVIESLLDKLKFSTPQFYGLTIVRRSEDGQSEIIVQDSDNSVHDKVALKLQEDLGTRCCLRVVFVPQELNELLARDPETFAYLYTQCCNDVIEERFAADMKWKEVLNLSSLHLLQWATDEKIHRNKILRNIESNWDLTPFVPRSLLTALPVKQIRKTIVQLVKIHLECFHNSFQLKLEYLRRITQLKSFASRQYQLEGATEKVIIGPRNGLQLLMDSKLFSLARFSQLASVTVDNRTESLIPNRTKVMVELTEHESKNQQLNLSLSTVEVEDFIARIRGFCVLHKNKILPLRILEDPPNDIRTENYTNGWITGDGMKTFTKRTDNFRESLFYDNYYGPQVTRGHFCRLSCGYSPEFEDVVNHLETVLPSKNGNNDATFPLISDGNGKTNKHSYAHSLESEALIQTFSNVHRWLTSQQNDAHACNRHDNGVNFSVDNGYHSDTGRDPLASYHSNDVDTDNNNFSNGDNFQKRRSSQYSCSAEDENCLRNFFNLEHFSEPMEEVNSCDLQNSRSNEVHQTKATIVIPPPLEFSDTPADAVDSSTNMTSVKQPITFEDEFLQHHLLMPPPDEFSSVSPSSSPLVQLPPMLTFDLSYSSTLPPPKEFASGFDVYCGWSSFENRFSEKKLLQSSDVNLKESTPKFLIDQMIISGLDKL